MFRKLLEPRIWKRIYAERLGEPLIYNIASCFVAAFGNVVKKIDYDLVPRQPYAFGLNEAFKRLVADRTRQARCLVFIEFGVASGAGLTNMCRVADRLSAHYGIDYKVIGFDTGVGMPAPVDYRDHPEKYLDGDFSPHDSEALVKSLPARATIKYGPIAETLDTLAGDLGADDVIGFVSIDVDYWSSTTDCLKLFDKPLAFLPYTPVYLDDVNNIDHHAYAGELLAVAEFNASRPASKIVPMNRLRNWRIFKNALWLDQMYWFIDLRSPFFTREYHAARDRVQLANPYLGLKERQFAHLNTVTSGATVF